MAETVEERQARLYQEAQGEKVAARQRAEARRRQWVRWREARDV